MDKFKRILFYLALVGLLLTAVSCQTNENNPDTENNETETTTEESTEANNEEASSEESGEQTIITFAVQGWERGLYEQMVTSFEEINPDIKVEIVSTDELLGSEGVSFGGPEQDDTLLNLVQGADVISWYLYPGGVQDGLLLDLEPLMTADEDFEMTDFYPGTLEKFQWDGGTWGIPTSASYMVIFYDKDLFDNAGIDYPEAGWNWDDFLAAAEATTLRDGDEVTQWGFSTSYIDPVELVQAKVGPVFDATTEPPTARLTDPDVVDAFQWLSDLHTTYEVAPFVKGFDPESMEEYTEEDFEEMEKIYRLVDEGKVAMWPDSSESYSWRSDERNIGVVPFPISEQNQFSSPLSQWGGSTLAISAGTASPQAAWAWIEFLTQQSNEDLAFFGPGGPTTLPARQSVAEASGIWDEMDESLATALQFAVEHGFVSSSTPAGGDDFYMAMAKIMTGEEDVAALLAEAQDAFETGVEDAMSEAEEREPVPEFSVAEPPSSQIDEGDTVVNFVVAGGDPSVYRRAAKDFNELHPDIVVQVREPNYYEEDFSLLGLIGDADAFQWWGPIRSGDDLEIVLPIQPLLSADAELAEDDFFPVVLNQFRAQGQVVGLPAEVQIPFLNYNKRLFDAAGLDYPEPGWTLDEFLETAVALTQGEGEDEKIYGYAPDLYEFGDVMTFLSLQGVTLIDDSVDPPQANFNNPDMISALRWYTNLSTEYEVKPSFDMSSFSPTSNPYEERLAMIENDRVGIWKADPYEGVYFDENGEMIQDEEDKSHIGVVPYPVGPGGTSNFESISGYYIAADTEVRQAAWEWIKYLTGLESLSQYGVPPRISTAESDEFVQRVGADKAAMFIAAMDADTEAMLYERMFSTEAEWISPAIGIGIENAFRNIVEEGMTVEEAMQIAQDKADNYRQCILENELTETDDYSEMESCLEEADLSWEDF